MKRKKLCVLINEVIDFEVKTGISVRLKPISDEYNNKDNTEIDFLSKGRDYLYFGMHYETRKNN